MEKAAPAAETGAGGDWRRKTEPKTETQTETEAKSETKTGTKADTEPKVETKTKRDTKTKTKTKVETEAEEVAAQLKDLHLDSLNPADQRQDPLRRGTSEGRLYVYFDLETTGLARTSHITQIAACIGEERMFSRFVLPQIPIEPGAARVTGITCEGQNMYHHGDQVPCLTIRPALEGFIDFLEEEEEVVIVGHNIRNFDCPVLLNALQSCDLVERFQRAVHSCLDTLPLFREINRKAANHKLSILYTWYTGQEFPAHDAREDIRALQRIVNMAAPDQDVLNRHSFQFDDVIRG